MSTNNPGSFFRLASTVVIASIMVAFVFILTHVAPLQAKINDGTQVTMPTTLAATSTQTPLFLVLSTWGNAELKGQSWDMLEKSLLDQGYKIEKVTDPDNPETQTFGVTIVDDGNKIEGATRITSSIRVTNNKIQSLITTFWTGDPGIKISAKTWNTIDPKNVITMYGSPDDMRAYVSQTGTGYGAALMITWERLGMSLIYNLPIYPSDYVSGNLPLCLNRNKVSQIDSWVVPLPGDVVKEMQKYDPVFMQVMRPFAKGMFVGVDTIEELAKALGDGKCLETPFSYWGYG